jgi:hypothetical protein
MATIREVLNNVKSFNLTTAAMDVVSENKEKLIAIQNKRLTTKGHGSDDNKLRPYKNKRYAIYKHEMNPLPGLGVPDLKLRGDYLNASYVNVLGNGAFEMGSNDWKEAKLRDMFGPNLGLSDKDKQDAVEEFFYEDLLDKVHEGMKL